MPTGAISVAEAYLSLLRQRGIDFLYIGAGTDSAPLVEAYARAKSEGNPQAYPQPVVTTHENLAVGMAHGYTMVTGRPQAVMVHVSVGTANAACGLINAARAQVPMLFTAGRTPIFEQGKLGARDSEVHWAQEMFDQAGMVRELVKWDYELRDGAQLHSVVDRALSIASAKPCGPVDLSLPREVLAAPAVPVSTDMPAQARVADPAPDAAALEVLCDALLTADFPIVLCTASGGDPSTIPALVALAEEFAIGVGEARSRYVCFPASHPLHLGHDMASVYSHADVVLFLESDVPWVPSKSRPADSAFVAHAGADPLYARYPMRSHHSNLTLTCTVQTLLPALSKALAGRRLNHDRIQARRERIAQHAAAAHAAVAARAAQERQRSGPISKAFLSQCLFDALPSDAIVVNKYPAVRECLPFEHGGQYFVHPTSAGLGWGFPAALGAKQAAPHRTVVALMGDGSYLFANPAVCHHAAAMHKLPVVAVVFDNGGWEAVQNAALMVYPEAHSAQAMRSDGMAPLSSLDPMPDFRMYAEASEGLGLRVTERAALPEALRRAIACARAGRQVLVHVIGKG
jgi:acetolactate synthase-1/2/3 large subunit